jgi:diadenosine tetraphosphate (Ap4A) HIT family hydrolase
MSLPYAEPLTVREPAPRTIPEPPRVGEPGGKPCRICSGGVEEPVWSNELWTLHPPSGCSLPGTVWLATKAHVDAFADLPAEAAADFGRIAGRVEQAVLDLGDIARVHLYRWGDGASHFHVWFLPRPLGMLDAKGMALPIWEDALPNAPDAELRSAAEQVAAALGRGA